MSAGEDRKVEIVVLGKITALPGVGVVTNLAILRKTRRLVVGIIGVVVVALVTRPTIIRSSRKSVAVAFLAVEISMSAGEAEELIVVDFGAFPGTGRMTFLAVAWKTGFDVVGIGRCFIGRAMTRIAICRCTRETVAMTLVAVQTAMGSSQSEELVVVCDGTLPRLGSMTALTVGREPCSDMVRIVGGLVVATMTSIALGGRALESVRVAILAIEAPMSSRKAKDPIVVEFGSLPRASVMTGLAIGGKARLDVVGILGTLVVLSMTAIAIGGGAHEPVPVAIRAVQVGVTVGQCKERMIEFDSPFDPRRLPGDARVAELAFDRESGSLMIRARGLSVVAGMAGKALGRGCGELEWRRPTMAARAIHAGMGSGQWEKGGVVSIPHLAAVVPGRRDMTAIAAKSQLTPVGIEVAIGTCGSHSTEFENLVTAGARHPIVAELEGESGRRVIEIDGIP